MTTYEGIMPFNEKNKLISVEDIVQIFNKFELKIIPTNINYYINSLTHKSYIKNEYYNNHLNIKDIKLPKHNTLDLLNESNERLEFLGDTIIKCIISNYLFIRYPSENEGFMTRLKTKIENRHTLANFAKKIDIGQFIIISKQVEDIGGRNSDKILEDCFESFIGALYLDAGYNLCRQFLYIILETEIEYSDLLYKDTNYKDQLLKYFHQNKWSYPQYVLLNTELLNGKKFFTMGVKNNNGIVIASSKALSKQKAEQHASMLVLFKFKVINEDQMVSIEDL